MKEILLVLIALVTIAPFPTLARESSLTRDYSIAMGKRLNYGINRNLRVYNNLLASNQDLARKQKASEEIDLKLVETKLTIDRSQNHLAELLTRATITGSPTPRQSYQETKRLVREIIDDIRLSYVKIKEIKLLIKQIN